MQVIPKCPHCSKELPGWSEPVQFATWQFVTSTQRQWQVCPLCKGTGIGAVQLNESSGSYPVAAACSFCHGVKVVATP